MNSKEFWKRVDSCLDALNFKPWKRDIVELWYGIEGEDEDMSTEYLIQRVCDECGKDVDVVLSVMDEFSEMWNEIYPENKGDEE